MQLEADIRSLLREGFSSAEVLETLGFRVALISHLAAALEADFSAGEPMQPVLEHLATMVSSGNGSRTERTEVARSERAIDAAAEQVMIELRHLEFDDEVPTASLAEWQSSLIAAISRHGEVLDASMLAREVITQLADLEQGSGVWVHPSA